MATGTINNQFLKKSFTFSNVTINAKDVYRYQGVPIPSGYIPIGVYLEISGAEVTISALPPHRRSQDTTAVVELYNSYTAALTVSGTINVVYMKI